MSEEPLFTEEHQRAIGEACEKLWNGSPPENPIYGPRPEGHPLRVVANKAHEALNAALAMETQYLEAVARASAAEAALAACEADTARLDWLSDPAKGCVSIGLNVPPLIPECSLYVFDRDAIERDEAFDACSLREAIDRARAPLP